MAGRKRKRSTSSSSSHDTAFTADTPAVDKTQTQSHDLTDHGRIAVKMAELARKIGVLESFAQSETIRLSTSSGTYTALQLPAVRSTRQSPTPSSASPSSSSPASSSSDDTSDEDEDEKKDETDNVSFAYSELAPASIQALGDRLESVLYDMSQHRLLDAGHANGLTLATLALRFPQLQCDGIEAHDQRHNNSLALKDHLIQQQVTTGSNLRFHKGNVRAGRLTHLFTTATVLYMYDMCYDTKTFEYIAKRLKEGNTKIRLLISSKPFSWWSQILSDSIQQTQSTVLGKFRHSNESHLLYLYFTEQYIL